jgi:hypothetical protein
MTPADETLRAIVLARGVKATLAAVAHLAGARLGMRGATQLEHASLRGLAEGINGLLDDYPEALTAIDRGRLRRASR